jgi:hypothetical protein
MWDWIGWFLTPIGLIVGLILLWNWQCIFPSAG